MKIKMSEEELFLLEEFIEVNKLKIEIVSVIKDESLYKLGFSDYIPCTVEINATEGDDHIRDHQIQHGRGGENIVGNQAQLPIGDKVHQQHTHPL